ncbi:hypothetical protein RBA41_01490 [Massilia sp. CCM 9210]|uniref:hypothetical protein n=1 Tax=Massilia scottii TaxID=3057166 RepID=UPI0027965F23|nr:hypothetical protein [Massilia sp. CCM 9210]MDQ1811968.1 hypothetical protein [Massilia sp. CCM 9210]
MPTPDSGNSRIFRAQLHLRRIECPDREMGIDAEAALEIVTDIASGHAGLAAWLPRQVFPDALAPAQVEIHLGRQGGVDSAVDGLCSQGGSQIVLVSIA